jgi:[ribosomal protein S18]-alanine N-acetyltransferase
MFPQNTLANNENHKVIRPYTPDDFDAIHAIDSTGHEFPWSEGGMRDCLALGHHCRVLEINGKVEAFIIFSIASKESELWNFCVAPPMRRRGYAKLLLEHVFAELREKGVDMLFLEVRRSNEPAQLLYRSLGFTEFSVRTDYYRYHGDSREDALVFALTL